jgi:hypothetical protein
MHRDFDQPDSRVAVSFMQEILGQSSRLVPIALTQSSHAAGDAKR